MRDYYCRFCCAYLFHSDAEVGRVLVDCHARRCGKRQTVHLGGERSAEDVLAALEELVGRLRERVRERVRGLRTAQGPTGCSHRASSPG